MALSLGATGFTCAYVISSVNEMVDPEFYPRGIQNTERLTTFFTKLKVLQSTQKGKS
jgi:inner membrane protein involved in colicin E2 resistance